MGQSLVRNPVHIIFSTKNREHIITEDIQSNLYAYLGAMCMDNECPPIEIGGWTDHVHILCLLSKKVAMMNLVEEVKAHSSKWMKTMGVKFENFYWQDGYAGFGVSPREITDVSHYIVNQKSHHEELFFMDEVRGLYILNDLKFDERYCWD